MGRSGGSVSVEQLVAQAKTSDEGVTKQRWREKRQTSQIVTVASGGRLMDAAKGVAGCQQLRAAVKF